LLKAFLGYYVFLMDLFYNSFCSLFLFVLSNLISLFALEHYPAVPLIPTLYSISFNPIRRQCSLEFCLKTCCFLLYLQKIFIRVSKKKWLNYFFLLNFILLIGKKTDLFIYLFKLINLEILVRRSSIFKNKT
jgi:hypothetical protein